MIDPSFEPTNACSQYMEENGSAAMLATKRLAGVTPEVNLRYYVTYTPPPSVNKATHSGFEIQRRHHQKSKTGYQRPHKKDLSPPIFFKKHLADAIQKLFDLMARASKGCTFHRQLSRQLPKGFFLIKVPS